MIRASLLAPIFLLLLLCPVTAHSQQPEVPQVVSYSVSVPSAMRDSLPRVLTVTARIYGSDLGGTPFWVERHEARPDSNGRVTVLLGSSNPLPSSIFASNAARWISVQFGEGPETPRAALVSVPYALKAQDADTLNGLPSSAFLTSTLRRQSLTASDNNVRMTTTGTATYTNIQPGALNMIPKFVSSVELGSSQMTDTGLGIGIGNSDPQEMLDISGRAIFRASSRGPAGMWFGNSEATSSFIGLRTSDPQSALGFSTGGLWRMNITPEGRVGIGVDTPLAALDVKGGIKLSSGALTFPDGTSLTSALAGSLSLAAGDASINFGKVGPTTTIAVADQGISTAKLADNSVSTVKIADGSITAAKLATGVLSGAGGVSLGANLYSGEQKVQVTTPLTPAVTAQNFAPTDSAVGVYALSSSPSGVAVKADATSDTGNAVGLLATSSATTGIGSASYANATTGVTIGAYGNAKSSSGIGVKGLASSSSGTTYGVYGETLGANYSAGVYGLASTTTATSLQYGVYGLAKGISGIGVMGFASNATSSGAGSPIGVAGVVSSTRGVAGQFVNSAASGNVLVAQNATGNVWRVDNTGNQYMNGTVHVGGADFAEMIESSSAARSYEPGDVLLIATTGDRHVELAAEPYSTRVVGIFATRPGVLASRYGTAHTGSEIPVAMLGIVPAKASAENGAIRHGDLLVTATTPGHVMKATDRQRIVGAIVGKAMQSLDSGTGVIEIAVTLQ